MRSRARTSWWLAVIVVAVGCGGSESGGSDDTGIAPDGLVDTNTIDSGRDVVVDAAFDVVPETSIDARDATHDGFNPACDSVTPVADPSNPPPVCGPQDVPPCGATGPVASCPPSDCMARTTPPSGGPYDFRIGRLRVWAPSALLSLAALAIDPNVNPTCFDGGADSANWLLHFDPSSTTLTVGSARSSTDGGTTYVQLHESSADPSSICPAFAGAPTYDLSPQSTTYTTSAGEDAAGPIARLNLPIFDSATGVPVVFPLAEVTLAHVVRSTDGRCIGTWEPSFWCDGDSLGWTTDGVMLAKMSTDDADQIPVKTAACQSLCAIMVNDATKTIGGRCKHGTDGKVIPGYGDACIGGVGCNDAFLMSFTFAAYAVKITP
jgi:hypothetical protein